MEVQIRFRVRRSHYRPKGDKVSPAVYRRMVRYKNDFMECFECIQACPIDALEMDKSVSCVRLVGSTPLRVVDDKCNECNQCNEACPMGNIALSAEGCSFCIVCKSSPSCLLYNGHRASFLDLILSIAPFVVLMRRFIF